jgi:hypothetical protein
VKQKIDMTGHDFLELKPDYQDALRRYEAFWNGDLIDRPLIRITAPKSGAAKGDFVNNYYTRANSDADTAARGLAEGASKYVYLGEAIPRPFLSFGCDEIAVFCGGRELRFNEGVYDTCWSSPSVEDWRDALPIVLREDNSLWQRMKALMDRSSELMSGKMLFEPLDLHTNMDLLLALRGSEQLCMDLMDSPEIIDQAMEQTMGVFDALYERAYGAYNLPGLLGATLQCDFSCMIGTEAFRRFALPFLEREAEYFGGRVFYHWDGVGALTHAEDLIASKGLYVMGFLPGAGHGEFRDFLELYEKIQKGKKAVWVSVDAEEAKFFHGKLRPERMMYDIHVPTEEEGRAVLDWFTRNT